MNFSIYSCKQFLKDYIDNNSDVAFSSEDRDVIVEEMSRTNTQFTFAKLSLLIKKLKNDGRLDRPQENKMEMNQLAQKEHDDRVRLYKFYLTSKYAHPSVNHDSLENTDKIWNGHKDSATGVIIEPGIMDLISYPRLELRHIVEVVSNLGLGGYLKYKTPQVVERVVEVQVDRLPTAQEIAKAKKEKWEREASQGFHQGAKNQRTELDRDDQFKKPPLTEQERVAINSRNARIDHVINETLSTIAGYSGPNHARTYERREQLRQIFEKFKYQIKDVESAEKLQRTITAQIDSYDKSSSGGIR